MMPLRVHKYVKRSFMIAHDICPRNQYSAAVIPSVDILVKVISKTWFVRGHVPNPLLPTLMNPYQSNLSW